MTELTQKMSDKDRPDSDFASVSPRHPNSRLDVDQLFLYEQLPPTLWQSTDYRYKTSFWLNIHADIRQHQQLLNDISAMYQAGDLSWKEFHAQLAPRIGQYIFKLHQHHNIEDQGYFPQFINMYPQLQSGFEILDGDHVRLDELLNDLQALNNKLVASDSEDKAVGEQLHQALAATSDLLSQHLSDEEDLVIPILGLH